MILKKLFIDEIRQIINKLNYFIMPPKSMNNQANKRLGAPKLLAYGSLRESIEDNSCFSCLRDVLRFPFVNFVDYQHTDILYG